MLPYGSQFSLLFFGDSSKFIVEFFYSFVLIVVCEFWIGGLDEPDPDLENLKRGLSSSILASSIILYKNHLNENSNRDTTLTYRLLRL